MRQSEVRVKAEPSEDTPTAYESSGRIDQKRRTREAIKAAAAGLVASGSAPTMADVADAAGVSRSSAYRYFPSIEALLAEVALDAAVSRDIARIDAVAAEPRPLEARLAAVVAADHAVVIHHEAAFRGAIRSMLASEAAHDRLPRRPGNRLRYLRTAVGDLEAQLSPRELDRLVAALALTVGLESRLVLCDIAGLSDDEAEVVKQWAASALLRAALEP